MTATVEAARSGLAPWLYALRRTWPVVLLVLVVVPAVVLVQVSSEEDGRFHTTATVAAVELDPEVTGLARIAEAVFDTPDVAEDIRDQVAIGGDPRRPPDVIRLEPVRDTILFRIHAEHRDPALAAALANAGADALVAELNEIGPGLGRFEVTTRARVPLEESGAEASPVVALVAVVGAAAVVVVFLLWWMSARRPLLSATDVEGIDATWVVDVGVLPGRDGHGPELHGLGQLKVPAASTVLVAGVGVPEPQRMPVVRAIAGLAGGDPVRLVLLGADRRVPDDLPADVAVTTIGVDQSLPDTDDEQLIVDFDTDEALVDVVQAGEEVFLVVVVARGTSQHALRSVAELADPDMGLGVVVVGRVRRR